MSQLITAGEVVIKMGKEIILDHVGFGIERGKKLVIVGRNGAGKTTLIKVLAGLIEIDEGEIQKPKDMTVGYLSQTFDLDESLSIGEILDISHPRVESSEIAKNRSQWSRIFQLPHNNTRISHLSGGQKRRLALTYSLLLSPDLLLLDEPTNHLDIVMIRQLENIIRSYSGTCVIISHDRYFVDKIGDGILEIDNKKVYSHTGGFSDFLQHRESRIVSLERQEEKRQDFLEREIEWVHAGVKARGTKNKGRLREYYEIKNQDGFKRKVDPLIMIPPSTEMGSKILSLKHLSVSAGDKTLANDLNFRIEKGYRIGIIGANGAGKTTLVKTLLGINPPSRGKVVIGDQTEFIYMDQDRQVIHENHTIMKEVAGNADRISFGEKTINSWGYLKRFVFSTEQITSPISHLSGGEKARVTLAKLFRKSGNFLVLDEPTNDLDLEMLSVLEQSLLQYSGCMMVISHDRYFLNAICTHVIALDGIGGCTISTGNYDDFVRKYGELGSEESQTPSHYIPIKDPKPHHIANTKAIKQLEKTIGALEKELEDLKAVFRDPQAYLKYGAKKLVSIEEEIQEKTRLLDTKMFEWLEIQER
jgi:ABC transport system ATP-binding/permease protein